MGIKGVFGVTKSGIPRGFRPDKNTFIRECGEYKARELAVRYHCHIDTICKWKRLYDISAGPLKPRQITWIVKGDCWICTSHKPGSTGYPSMRMNGRSNLSILKLKYEQKYGKIPKGKCMLHKCDNRRCINPDHVMIGSKGDNCRDRHVKKRDCHGTMSPQHKLDEQRVIFARELRLSGYYYWQIANFFGVHTTTICDALTGRSWVQAFGGEKNRRFYKSRE
jgi:hypothetical protein